MAAFRRLGSLPDGTTISGPGLEVFVREETLRFGETKLTASLTKSGDLTASGPFLVPQLERASFIP